GTRRQRQMCIRDRLMEEHETNGDAATVLTARLPDPSGYGRIVRDERGDLQAIVEDKDLDPRDRAIDEINSGIYAFRTGPLVEALASLRDDNRQKELYLTDTIRSIRERGMRVSTYTLADPLEISGINTPEQLEAAAAVLARRREQGSEDCPICALASRAGDGYPVLARLPGALLVVTARPYNSGQVTAHPERHVLHHSSLRPEERGAVWALAQRGARAVDTLYHPGGMNLGAGPAQPGAHLAIEVIPRWVGDMNFLPILANVTLLPEEPRESWERLRRVLESEAGTPPTEGKGA
ncbi:MAG: sugar phosphate nucleotidyltransferase, partial [Candidatus Eisenbacteria bacterium]|nr:sugar phosphate nucleotidyltransferase [Candidatus Eisenbacteria bacterium]